ncbi:MAG: DUF3243 domain-containing protein [Firmicutes bacterium]|uniref:DUF3243 domain-containing protein n=1 Tax=Melghirimyces thermohalophilus TaxID=1236220 RepID=A0A1G6J366_9BACL|nr:DUF3243 domain-containing protein [Melghirimyces thermohalophilus]MDA8352725.1 DUF3243 domain-containing protein [Bacillota bacterium]SDC13089.1 Protein of unknown function [Melghirimyces thermohalophilus]
MSVLNNFQDWKNFLNERVEQAQSLGMDNEALNNAAVQIGEYLSKEIDPKNDQERMLKELWDAADEQEKHTMANLMVKLVHGGDQQS